MSDWAKGFVFSSLIFLAAFSMTVYGFIAEPQYRPAHERPHGESAEGQPHKSLWEKTTEDPVAFFTLCLFGVTGLLAADYETSACWRLDLISAAGPYRFVQWGGEQYNYTR